MYKIAISLGDINGVGLEIALKSHDEICKIAKPVYCINRSLLEQGAKILNQKIPHNFEIFECGENFKINPGKISKKSGKFSFLSFKSAVNLAISKQVNAICTMPINKNAWSKAGIKFVGHTDYLSHKFKKNAIMMLGCDELFVALFTDHIALKNVSEQIKVKKLTKFLCDLYKSSGFEKIGVLGFNPHASDNGVIGGKEEIKIQKSIILANSKIKNDIFFGPLVPDAAFNKFSLKNCNRLVAMYHDGGLAPLKALFFDKSINVSLNLPIIRTSVDHGTAYDIAYKGVASNLSYLEAIRWAIKFSKN